MTISLQALKGQAGTEWQNDWESLIDYTEGGLNEIETARQGQVSLTANFDRYVLKTGLVSNFSGNNYRITTLADAVNPQDAVNLQTVQSLISGGGSPSNIAITALNKGTATALQLYRVNASGTAIEGVATTSIASDIALSNEMNYLLKLYGSL